MATRGVAEFAPTRAGLRHDQVQDATIAALTAAAARGEPAALALGIDFLTVDPPMFAGRGAKVRLANVLRRHAARIDRANLPALFAHWYDLFTREVVPQEGERVARLLGALADAGQRERALAIPVVIPWVERCIRRIVPDLSTALWDRMPAAVRAGTPRSWRRYWAPDDRHQLGRAVAASVPIGRRCEWVRDVLTVAARDRRIDEPTRALLTATAPTASLDVPTHRRSRLQPGPDTWYVAMAEAVRPLTWEPASVGIWRLAPLLARACAGGDPRHADDCWQALTRHSVAGSDSQSG